MLYIAIIEGILLLIGIIYIINIKNKYNKNSEEFQEEQKKIFEANWARKQRELESSFTQENQRLEAERRKSEQGARDAQFNLTQLNKEIEDKKKFNASLREIREEELDRLMATEKEKKLAQIAREVDEWAQSAQEAASEMYEIDSALYIDKMAQAKKNLSEILDAIEDYRKKREAINQEILREKNLKLQKDAHRIILSEEDKEDIAFLVSILPKINHKEILYKLIWSEYLIRPFQAMIKNSFGGNIPKNVIYCIESSDGKLKYIGKTSTDVSKRWTEHIKTSLNIGGVSRSKLHDALYLHWDEFLFSVIEETTKEQLSEREKYYINFFESDKYGLNIKSGG